jgi:hypothetical protein
VCSLLQYLLDETLLARMRTQTACTTSHASAVLLLADVALWHVLCYCRPCLKRLLMWEHS